MDLENKKTPEVVDQNLVVIGAGAAGLAAALTAAEHGIKKITIIEKAAPGGNSAMAHDVFGVESPVQKRNGSTATRDQFFEKAMNWAHWSKVNPLILRAFIDKSGDTIGWLQSKGLSFYLGQYYHSQSPRIRHVIEGRGAQLIKVLIKECVENGVQILRDTAAKKIIRDGNQIVTGVIAMSKEQEIVINAKSVIITTGGYARNEELLKKHCSWYNPETNATGGSRSNTGDGLQMAIGIGAATAGLGTIMFHGPTAPYLRPARIKIGESKYGLGILVREPVALWVNKRGKRFINEGHNMSSFASAAPVAQQPGGRMYTIFDDKTRTIMEEEGLIWPGAYGGTGTVISKFPFPVAGEPLPGLGKELRAVAANSDIVKIAVSLDEIAQWIGVAPLRLQATVDEYNAACDQGYDPIFCKDRRHLLPIRSGPFYAIQGVSTICDAIGGIKINENMEVLDSEDEPIPGLFAGGSCTGCWETENYCYELTGHMLGFALNSGRIAAENAARYMSL